MNQAIVHLVRLIDAFEENEGCWKNWRDSLFDREYLTSEYNEDLEAMKKCYESSRQIQAEIPGAAAAVLTELPSAVQWAVKDFSRTYLLTESKIFQYFITKEGEKITAYRKTNPSYDEGILAR